METALPKFEANVRWSLENVERIERTAGWRAWAAAETPGKVPRPHHPFPSSVMREEWLREGMVLRLTGRTVTHHPSSPGTVPALALSPTLGAPAQFPGNWDVWPPRVQGQW